MPGKRERELLASSRYLGLKYSATRAPRTPYPARFVAELTRRVYGTPGPLLELGCGRGDFLQAFRAAGYRATGVDIHEERHPDAEKVDLDEPLPFADASFEQVFTKSVVEHLSDPLFTLTEAFRVLTPGGRIAVLTPSWRHTGGEIFYSEYTHVRPFTRQSLAEVPALAGFAAVEATYFWQLPHLWAHPWLRPLTALPRVGRIPYRPVHSAPWPASFNRAVRFSREVMLLGVGVRPEP